MRIGCVGLCPGPDRLPLSDGGMSATTGGLTLYVPVPDIPGLDVENYLGTQARDH